MAAGTCVEGCGACCNPVVSIYGPFDVAMGRSAEAVWLRDNTTFIRGGRGRLRHLEHRGNEHPLISLDEDGSITTLAYFYDCHHYDETTGQCTDYDNRPEMCRGYPWYGERPDRRKALPMTCGYRVDIGDPVTPVTLRTRQR